MLMGFRKKLVVWGGPAVVQYELLPPDVLRHEKVMERYALLG